jgi:hypothetical protein
VTIKPEFLTVPEELLECASSARQYFKDWGFRIYVEPSKPEYPMTPTMVCTQGDRTVIVEVHGSVVKSRLEDWTTYCASCERNRELILCVPNAPATSIADMELLGRLRVGLYRANADSVSEVLRPIDLAMRAEMPKPENLPGPVRNLLVETYEHWNRGDWKDAFGLATEVLDEQAKEYLKRECSRGRVVVLNKDGAPITMTPSKISRMTLGALAVAFAGIQAPTDIDSTIASTLAAINADRVKLRHYRRKKASTPGFRRRVGPHMHMIVRALKEILAKK